ncbi:hypothetical protein EXU57_05315 [Segetibacter sp. 3557_3]|uniref:hypothetical protein n=1 Tax=Segetibacter sp. 3557_3 TaxID=2547429 RepID=UPI001058AE3D|nr:hypothetical protein [Segetibacter sp. 3557_3]TDH27885.1 hypothetical protein EXU57_05315 [Segetibacter sp. 3557_3]
MKDVPHWQWLMVMYFLLVAIPVYMVHAQLKKRAFANRNFTNLLLYFVGVFLSAFVLHGFTMWLYFTFFFPVKD